jgi:serine/threonine protein kinase
MKAERFEQVDQIFQAALEHKPAERAAFLDKACAGDTELRSKVEALISSDEKAGSFIERSAFEVAAEMIAGQQSKIAAGQGIGPYEVVSRLGSGGMGDVYLAHDSRLGRKVALKLLPEYFTKNKHRLERFQQEARAASALNHPNIITIFEIGKADSIHFIATEYITGQTLRERMSASKMNLGEALDVAIQVASALASAHQAGIVHRDIKPENMMLREDGYVKVLDFGLAKLTQQEPAAIDMEAPTKSLFNTDAGVVMGTPSYMSPEQARGHEVDWRTDIFSLGVVVYEMVTGRLTFEGETTSDVIAAILRQELAPLGTYSSEVPDELEWIIAKTLAKDKEERYQTVKEMLFDLRRLKQRVDYEAEQRRSMSPDLNARSVTTSSGPIITAAERLDLFQIWHLSYPGGEARRITNDDSKNYRGVSLTADASLLVTTQQDEQSSIWIAPDGDARHARRITRGRYEGRYGVAWTPEGRIVYHSFASGNEDIWIMNADGSGQRQLTADPGTDDNCCEVSPDGRYIIFRSERGVGVNLWRMDSDGGNLKQLTRGGNQPAVSPDGKWLIYHAGYRLWKISIDGGEPAQLNAANGETIYTSPAISPTGNLIACEYRDNPGTGPRLAIIPPEGSEPIKLFDDRRENLGFFSRGNPSQTHRRLQWTPDGQAIAYLKTTGGVSNIWSQPLDGGPPKQLTDFKSDSMFSFGWSRDGKQLVYARGAVTSDVVLIRDSQ